MEHIDVNPYINTIIGMIGITYPFLLQVITNFDSKYSNDKITELFEEEPISKSFKTSLYISLFFVVIWSLKLKRLTCYKSKYDWFIFLIDNSGDILIAINAIVLVILFFFYVKKVLIYTTPSRLIPYIIKKYKNVNEDANYFEILKELFIHFLRNQQPVITNKISTFFYFAFQKFRKISDNKPIIYPNEYYNLVYRSIEELAILKDKRNIDLEYRTAGSLWLIGETYDNEISDVTYNWIWNNLQLAIRHNQDDFILHHWENCHQYFSLNLKYIHPNYDSTIEAYQVSYSEEIKKRNVERKKFKEFHIALGALLLFKNRYTTLKEIFEYTQSEPPTYELFPDSLFEILSFYVKFSDPYDREYFELFINYAFPNTRGMNGEKVVKHWICKYLSILFIRYFSITYIPTEKNFSSTIEKPLKGDTKVWIIRLRELMNYLMELYSDKTFLVSLNIEYLTPEFIDRRNSMTPIEFLNNYISELEKVYTFNIENAIIDSSKVSQFNKETDLIISQKIEILKQVNLNDYSNESELDIWYVNGVNTVVERDFLAVDSEAEYLNLNSILAENIVENLSKTFSATFNIKTTISYLIKSEEILLSIQKLNLDSSFVIINFGLDLSELSNITIISFEEKSLGAQVLYILKKSDLPIVSTLPLEPKDIEKYHMVIINENLNLYTTHVSLNDSAKDIYQENIGSRTEKEMKKCILLGVFLKTQIAWMKKVNVMQIKSYSIFSIDELPNTIEDIIPFN